MFRTKPLISTAIIVFGLSHDLPTRADVANAKHEIQAVYDQRSKAYSEMDTDTILASETDDYALIDVDGQTHLSGKDAERERLTKVWSVASSIHDKVIVKQVTSQHDGTIAIVNEDYMRVQTSPDGTTTAVYREVVAMRTFWVNSPDGWQVKQEHLLHQTKTLTVNGVLKKKEVDGKKVR